MELARHLKTTIRYDGPALVQGEMDVQDLAPALIALAEIAKIANQRFNGGRASIRILVNADIEHKCFQLDLSLVQSWIDTARQLIGDDNVTTLQQLGAILGYFTGAAGGVFGIYKWAFAKGDAKPNITLNYIDARGVVILMMPDGRTYEADPKAWDLANDARLLPHIKTVLSPLEKEGYDDFEIIDNGERVVSIDRETARAIRASSAPVGADDSEAPYVSTLDGQVEIHTARFRGTAEWGLW
ncbi:hypothetical protein [Glacieibacterium sp.]|uniref:hypothetical protein n=1 Tax=Glacieibacterium sp. TaxID=2860237 RepID=UPI003AFF9162